MGMCLEKTPEMGEFEVEVRRESFMLYGADTYDGVERAHAIYLYPNPPVSGRQGSIEIALEDIPAIKAAIAEVERYLEVRARQGRE